MRSGRIPPPSTDGSAGNRNGPQRRSLVLLPQEPPLLEFVAHCAHGRPIWPTPRYSICCKPPPTASPASVPDANGGGKAIAWGTPDRAADFRGLLPAECNRVTLDTTVIRN